eukprot:SAG31_NODE_4096_length_3591_cov_2.039805_4_plen_64_part_00
MVATLEAGGCVLCHENDIHTVRNIDKPTEEYIHVDDIVYVCSVVSFLLFCLLLGPRASLPYLW